MINKRMATCKYMLLLVALSICHFGLLAQITANGKLLQKNANAYHQMASTNKQKAYELARLKHWDTTKTSGSHSFARLMGIDRFNYPVYYTTFNNIDAAATIGTNQLWKGGTSGLNLSGSSANMKNKLAIWDAGRVLDTHVELAGRIVRMDSSNYTGGGSDHATHVTGTMIATGINLNAKGMSYGLQSMLAYDFDNDIAEMGLQADKLLLSNHSYGDACGWFYNSVYGYWEFLGRAGENEDYKFGYYDDGAASLDGIAYNAPYYLIVKAAGNNRNVTGPPVGGDYVRVDSTGTKVDGTRPAGISSNNSYGIIPTNCNAKNIITVGAVYAITGGYTSKNDVVMSNFSNWGPTDDGRIKPDLVADGISVLSTSASGNTSYLSESGTSMAAPGVTGSLLLLQEYYAQLNDSSFMRSATLKGLAIHTADEAGDNPGPDYKFGWGLLNTQKAAAVLTAATPSKSEGNSKHHIFEYLLENHVINGYNYTALGDGKLTATLCWTDPAGNVETVNVLNNPTPKLVNDLDLRVTKNGTTYYPWVLNPIIPAAAATKGDNTLDNVEQVVIDSLKKGDVYSIEISHKGSLTNGEQLYSLIITNPFDTILPLRLLSFSASLNGTNALLKWATTSEVNAQSFIIEHSIDGIAWQQVATLPANNTIGTHNYSTYATPVDGINYYRLKMIDLDGAFTYSPVQTVQAKERDDLFIIAPNPASNKTVISFKNGIQQAVLNVYNADGKLMQAHQVNLPNGGNYVLSTSTLAAGNYTVSVKTGGGVFTKKLVVKQGAGY
ncbi:S8 family serine peptidase [Parasediminibacterium sp. JCM 36343]|uniref:S8 family serine peptidase n=1 Tax=Parasediminibacterium sp. JCM 36343 TaxID=3374279 RepID=UPI00397C3B26